MAKYDFTPISNIITEMVIKGATKEELSRMVEYSHKLIDCEKAYIENNIQALIEKYCMGKPVVRLTEREKAYVNNDIEACAEKMTGLGERFARFLDRGPMEVLACDGPEYHANDYVHFKEPDGFHFGRVISYNPETMCYKVYDLGEGTMYLVAAKNIISKSEEVKKDGE